MPTQHLPAIGQQRGLARLRLTVAKTGQPFTHPAVAGDNIGHPVGNPFAILQRAAEVHQPTTLGVDRHAAPVRLPQAGEHRGVFRNPCCVQLRVTAPEPDHLAVR